MRNDMLIIVMTASPRRPGEPRGAQSSPGASAEPSCPALRGKRAASWSGLAAGGTGQGLGPVTELQFPAETRDPAR